MSIMQWPRYMVGAGTGAPGLWVFDNAEDAYKFAEEHHAESGRMVLVSRHEESGEAMTLAMFGSVEASR